MIDIDPNTPGMAEAMAKLAEMEAAETAPASTPATAPDGSATDGQRAAQVDGEQQQQSSSPQSDTQATAAEKTAAATTTSNTTSDQPPQTQQAQAQPPSESRYSKAQKDLDRRERSWQELNRQKEELAAQRAEFDRQRQELESRRRGFEQDQAKPKFTPEQYEESAAAWEKEGKFDLADLARQRAADLRKNPPQAQQQSQGPDPEALKREQAAEAQRKEWWHKAVEQWPTVGTKGTPENAKLHEFLSQEPAVAAHPKGLYFASRMVTAESAAARVPDMEKELGALRARVKELETATSPSGQAAIPSTQAGELTFNQKSESEQEAELRQMAEAIGSLR